MTLTKRQWIMFTLFIIELAYVLLTAARIGDLRIISGGLSTLLFLGALYLEHNPNSKRILLLAGVWLIVNMIFTLIQILPAIFTSFNLYIFIELAVLISLYVGIYLFSMKYYKGNFYRPKDNWVITLLVAPMILLISYSAYVFFSIPISGHIIDILYIVFGFISSMILSIAIITYTWLRHKNIQ